MLRSFLRFFRSADTSSSLAENDRITTTIYAMVPRPPQPARDNSPQPIQTENAPSSHRQRVLSMRLEHTRICGRRRTERLARLGIETVGDLASIDPQQVAQSFGSPKKATRILQQYRRAARFSASVPGMMPRDAMLLVRIHRRSVRGLARETPSLLHRDLERYAESSQGQSHLRGQRLPSVRRIKSWIRYCESMQLNGPAPTGLV